jgi:hypothetical protein
MALSRLMLTLLARSLLARLLLALLARLLSTAALLLPALATLAGLLLLLARTRVVLLVRVLVGIGHSRCSSWVVEAIAPSKSNAGNEAEFRRNAQRNVSGLTEPVTKKQFEFEDNALDVTAEA